MSTKIKSFEAAVTARAKERVQKRITTFKQEYRRAFSKLFDRRGDIYHRDGTCTPCSMPSKKAQEQVANIMASCGMTTNWPTELWTAEEETVRGELFAAMDKCLLAKASGSDDVCHPKAEVADVTA